MKPESMQRPELPAIALIEFDSIARALRSGDAMVKKATVRVALSEPISPGKYLILLSGMEAEVEESWRAGVSDGAEAVVDSLFLPGVHLDVVHGIHGTRKERRADHSLGIIETSSVAAAVLACDAALKETPVSLLEMRLGKGIGGKGVFSLAGELWNVQASISAACSAIEEKRALIASEIIARPDADFQGGLY